MIHRPEVIDRKNVDLLIKVIRFLQRTIFFGKIIFFCLPVGKLSYYD